MNSTERTTLPQPLLWGILLGFSLLLCLVAAELFLRMVPGAWSSSFFYIYDPLVGTWHFSDFIGDNFGTDYSVRGIRLNRFGMRDSERSRTRIPGVTRIAVLGDSIIEGMQVSNDAVLTRQMESLFGEDVEVLNFGVAGFGTLQEYLMYTERVRMFHPDIVILGFYIGNDLRNNSRELESLYNKVSDRPFLQKMPNGSWEVVPVAAKVVSQHPVVLFLKRHFALYRFLWFKKGTLASFFLSPQAEQKNATSSASINTDAYLMRSFAPPSEEPFFSAWETTEHLLNELDARVKEDGARLVLVTIPDPIAMEADPKSSLEELLGEPLPEGYDAEYPQKRLARFALGAGIDYLDLTPAFKAYRDAHALSSPYFSFVHDGHWSALGHQVAAEAIVSFLRDSGLLHDDT